MGKRRVSSVKRKRGPRRRTRGAKQTLPAVGVGSLRLIRNFTFYPKQLASDKPVDNFWLDKLLAYGAIAMKIFLAAVAYTRSVGATLAPYASVQCIAIGAEDLLWSSAIKEVRRVDVFDDQGKTFTLSCPCVDYRQARLRQMTVRFTPSSDLAKRGGRVCIAIVPLSLAEAEKLVAGTSSVQQVDFSLLLQMPGATVAPASRVVSKSWKPKTSDLGHEFRECGSSVTPTFKVQAPAGGLPICLVYLGYQDMAGSKPDPTVLYSPEEATFNIDISGAVDLREYGTSYIRRNPKQLFNTATVGVIHPDRLIPTDYPVSGLVISSERIVLSDSLVGEDLRVAFQRQGGGSSISGFSNLEV